MTRRVRVWDGPVRAFHWGLVGCMAGAVYTGLAGGNLMVWHGRLGVALLGLLAFRLAWGLVGSETARFRAFVRGPSAVKAYLRGQWSGIGHNPLGALSVLGLLGVLAFQGVSGLFANDDIAFSGPLRAMVSGEASQWWTSLHRLNVWPMAAIVVLHVGAIAFYARVKGLNLVRPMVTGYTTDAPAGAQDTRGGGWRALGVALACAALAVWVAQGGLLPAPPPAPPPASLPAW